jgi:endonuclease/exonuclease/phosphatase family metal-dependent hydrolase
MNSAHSADAFVGGIRQDLRVVEIRIGTFNYKAGGWSETTRRHDHQSLVDVIAGTSGGPPHILALPEATLYREFQEQPLWEAVHRLNTLWQGEDFYYPFLSYREGSRNHPALLVSARHVRPLRWFAPGPHVRRARHNFLLAQIAGQEVYLNSLHWDGSSGPDQFSIQAALASQMASVPCILAGDFNATSSCAGEIVHSDWHERMAGAPWKWSQKGIKGPDGRWHVNTEPMDDLLASGFVDAGQQAGDFTVTNNSTVDYGSGLRIDRILWSRKLDAELVPGSYRVHIPEPDEEKSDHRYVTATLDFADTRAKNED